MTRHCGLSNTLQRHRHISRPRRLCDDISNYVKCLQKAGYKKLFPHLQDGKNGYKQNMCRMFGEYLDLPEVNIVDPLKVFHSFRHTVVTKLTGVGVNEGLKRAMVGHDIDTKQSAHDDYTHLDALTIPNLQTAINRLNFEGVDFSALKIPADSFLTDIAKRIKQQNTRNSDKNPNKEI